MGHAGIAAVTVDNVSARAGPLIPVQHGSSSDNSGQDSVHTIKLPAVQDDPAAITLEEKGHAKNDIGDLYFVDTTVTPNHTNGKADLYSQCSSALTV